MIYNPQNILWPYFNQSEYSPFPSKSRLHLITEAMSLGHCLSLRALAAASVSADFAEKRVLTELGNTDLVVPAAASTHSMLHMARQIVFRECERLIQS